MTEVRISCTSDFPGAERELLSSFLPAGLHPIFEDEITKPPSRRWIFMGGGGLGESLLAPLVVTLLGGGALIVLKAFLESVGSELGKSFMERWKSRTTKQLRRSQPGFVILCELRPKLIAVVRLDTVGLEQHDSEQLLGRLELLEGEICSEEAVLWAEFDSLTKRWVVERQYSPGSGVAYRDADGEHLVHS